MSVPDIQDELNRKVSETVQNLLRRHEQKLIDDDQLFIGMQAIWGVASGLVDQSLTALVSSILGNQDDVGREETRLYTDGKKLLALTLRRMVDQSATVELRQLPKPAPRLDRFESTDAETGCALGIRRRDSIDSHLVKTGHRRLM